MEGLVSESKTEVGPATADPAAEPRKVLVTGADGYIGSVLCPVLEAAGFSVTGVDTGFYRAGWLFHDNVDRPRILTRDIRKLRPWDLEWYDAIVHLAELSNDPLCAFKEELTYSINHLGSVALANAAKAAGIRRFVYASSCSVYGAGGNDIKTESAEVNPLTSYARCKALVERDVSALADDTFSPTFLRFATAFGASPRMRFDIVLNNLAGLAWTSGRIAMTSDGMPWRPLAHVRDISAAITAVLSAPRDVVFNEAFNVGDDRHNYRIRDISAAVAEAFPNCAVQYGSSDGDDRSYRVSFAKIRERLPGFRCQWDAYKGAFELRRLFERIDMSRETFNALPYTRLNQLKQLCAMRQLDDKLYWRPHDLS